MSSSEQALDFVRRMTNELAIVPIRAQDTLKQIQDEIEQEEEAKSQKRRRSTRTVQSMNQNELVAQSHKILRGESYEVDSILQKIGQTIRKRITATS